MKKIAFALTLTLTLILTGLATTVLAAGPEEGKPIATFKGAVRASEVEPNDDCTQATLLPLDDAMLASINPVGDNDWYEVTVDAGGCYRFETAPGEGQVGGDTRMWIWGADCTTQVAFNDDGGGGLYSYITHTFVDGGTYFVEVDEYGDNGTIDAYVLTFEACPAPPTNDTCDGAIDLQEQGLSEFTIDLCDYAPDYTPAEPECTNDYPANGPDALYKIYLDQGETFTACENPCEGSFIDLAIWLVTDCGDPENTCVAGDDSGNPECIEYEATAAGWYYLVVDTYSGCGCVVVTIDSPIATESLNWGAAKALYR